MMSAPIDSGVRIVPGLLERVQPKPTDASVAADDEGGFASLVQDFVQTVNTAQHDSAAMQEALLTGQPVELHDVMIEAEKAGVTMDLLLEIRNRLVTAYNDIMRMPL